MLYLNFIVNKVYLNIQGIQAKLHENFQSNLGPRNKIPDNFVNRGKHFFVAKLIYNSRCLSVCLYDCNAMKEIEDRKLIFLVKIL